MRRLSIAVLAVALLAVSPTPALAGPGDTTVQIRSNAELVIATTIEVVVVVSCAPYAYTFGGDVFIGEGVVYLQVNQAETAGNGYSSETFPCDGTSHTVALFVSPGPWQLGEALVAAQACGFVCTAQVVKYVHIN
jgi:hypothetical protein